MPAAAAAAVGGPHGLLPSHLASLGGGLSALAGAAGLGGPGGIPGLPGMPPQMPGVPPPPGGPGGIGSGLLALGSVAGALVGNQYPFQVNKDEKDLNDRTVCFKYSR